MMRLVIGKLLALVERYPPLVDGAFVIIAWVGVKLLIEYLHAEGYVAFEIPKWLSLGLIVVIFGVGAGLRAAEGTQAERSGGADGRATEIAAERCCGRARWTRLARAGAAGRARSAARRVVRRVAVALRRRGASPDARRRRHGVLRRRRPAVVPARRAAARRPARRDRRRSAACGRRRRRSPLLPTIPGIDPIGVGARRRARRPRRRPRRRRQHADAAARAHALPLERPDVRPQGQGSRHRAAASRRSSPRSRSSSSI